MLLSNANKNEEGFMKIGISSEGKTILDFTDPRFGRCEYFQVYDTDTQKLDVIINKGKEASGGAGIVASNQLVDENVDIIITGNLGPNAFEIINKSGIKAYSCEKISVSQAIEKFKNNELKLIDMSGPSHQGIK